MDARMISAILKYTYVLRWHIILVNWEE